MPIRVFVIALMSALSPALCVSDEESAGIIVEAQGPQQILVLTSGKVVTGRITPRPDGYDVAVSAGRIFVPSELVRFQASDLEEAYIRMRETLPELTPNHHVELARWCAANKLAVHERRELLDALRLDPNRGDAKRMLQALLNQHPELRGGTSMASASSAGRTTTGSPGMGVTVYSSSSPHRSPHMETRSLGGFSRPVAQEFMQRVQPLLVNKCGSSGCHGNDQHSFVVISTRNGSTPLIAERNLAAALKHIDLSRPENSPLLQATTGSHGGSGESIFQGRTGNIQIRILRDWVNSVSRELSPEEAAPAAVAARADRPLPTTLASPGSTTSSASERPQQQPHGQLVAVADADERILQQVDRLNRRDAFDPMIFNQKYHQAASQDAAARRSPVPAGSPDTPPSP